jgi:Trp operon repressor
MFYIQHYDSFTPKGYNMTIGGENGPAMKGFDNSQSVITPEKLNNIVKDIKTGKLNQREIAKKYNVGKSTIELISVGKTYKLENEKYPLCKFRLTNTEVEEIINLLKNTDISYIEIGKLFNKTGESIAAINKGKNKYNPEINYPIRKSS